LPRFNAKTGKMEPSTVSVNGKKEMVNMTLINLCLQACGSMSEERLCTLLLVFQTLCCALGLYFRYFLAQMIFD
jgi:hypothetical protein